MELHNIENIISKEIIEGLNDQERLILDGWLKESENNRREYEAYLSLWEKSKKMVLSDQIDVESALKETKSRIKFLRSKHRIVYLRQAVAVLLVSLLLTFSYNYLTKNALKGDTSMVFQEIKASYGAQSKIELSDGTKVWLNSGSTLKFPNSFNGKVERMVELNGEGFFDVSKDDSKPFIVNTSKLNIKVHGTKFNVSAYDNYKLMTVALTEGKVSLISDEGRTENELFTMNPKDVVEFDSENTKLYHQVDAQVERYAAWKDGNIIFFNDPVDVVVRRLEKWYNVEIEVADKGLNSYRFTARFSDETLEQVLNLLSISSSMTYKVQSAKKIGNDSFTRRKVILSIKK